MNAHTSVEEPLLASTYTRSRRFPKMFGRMPGRDGAYLPGGPYTMTQLTAFLAVLLLVWKVPVAAVLGPVRWLIPFTALLLRRARIESRTPLGWAAGVVGHLLTPTLGTLDGRGYVPSRPVWTRTRLHLHHRAVTEAGVSRVDRAFAAPASATDVEERRSAATTGLGQGLAPGPVSMPTVTRRPHAPAGQQPISVISPLRQMLARAGAAATNGSPVDTEDVA